MAKKTMDIPFYADGETPDVASKEVALLWADSIQKWNKHYGTDIQQGALSYSHELMFPQIDGNIYEELGKILEDANIPIKHTLAGIEPICRFPCYSSLTATEVDWMAKEICSIYQRVAGINPPAQEINTELIKSKGGVIKF